MEQSSKLDENTEGTEARISKEYRSIPYVVNILMDFSTGMPLVQIYLMRTSSVNQTIISNNFRKSCFKTKPVPINDIQKIKKKMVYCSGKVLYQSGTAPHSTLVQ